MGVWGSEWLGQDPEVLSQEIPSAVESEPDTFQNTLGAHQAISSPPFPSSSTGWSTGFGTKQAWTRRHLTSLSLGPPPATRGGCCGQSQNSSGALSTAGVSACQGPHGKMGVRLSEWSLGRYGRSWNLQHFFEEFSKKTAKK